MRGGEGNRKKGLAIRGVLTAAVLLCAAGGKVNSSLHQSIGRSCACSREFWSVWGLAINQSVKQSINQSINQGLLRPAVALAHCTSTLSRAIPYSNKSLMRNPVHCTVSDCTVMYLQFTNGMAMDRGRRWCREYSMSSPAGLLFRSALQATA